MILDNTERNGKEVLEDNHKDKGNVHALKWEVYIKQKKNFTKTQFYVVVTHPKVGNIVQTYVEDNINEEKQDYK